MWSNVQESASHSVEPREKCIKDGAVARGGLEHSAGLCAVATGYRYTPASRKFQFTPVAHFQS